MTTGLTLVQCLVVWVLVIGAVQLIRWRRGGVGGGLVMAYVVNLWLIHWPAAAVYVLPWYAPTDGDIVAAGFLEATYAIVAFGIGSALLAGPLVRMWTQHPSDDRPALPRVARVYLLVGFGCYLVPLSVAGLVPSAAALVSAGRNLLIVGLALLCWDCMRLRRERRMAALAATAVCFPLVSLLGEGFLMSGTAAVVALFAFIGTFYRPRWKVVLVGVGLAYLGLSLYVTYLRDRVSIRETVWGGQGMYSRVERVSATLGQFEWFDPTNGAHLARIDDRLNQNRLLGSAVLYLDLGLEEYAQGNTLLQALVATVPRAVWPSKPFVAGSGGLVSQYTGMLFAAGTSVGIGNVMEFYVNFGTAGVVLGSLLLGITVGVIDGMAGRRLAQQRWPEFAAWFLPGLAALQVGGSLVEVTSSLSAAALAIYLVNRFVIRRSRPPIGPLRDPGALAAGRRLFEPARLAPPGPAGVG
jgi:hypothetical protein